MGLGGFNANTQVRGGLSGQTSAAHDLRSPIDWLGANNQGGTTHRGANGGQDLDSHQAGIDLFSGMY